MIKNYICYCLEARCTITNQIASIFHVLRAGYCLLIHLKQVMPKEKSCLGFSIQDKIGSGKRMWHPERKADNSFSDKQAVLQWESSSAITVPLEDLLGTHSQWIVAPNAAATPLAALMTVVAHKSVLDLPLTTASEAAMLSSWKFMSIPNHLHGSKQSVARNDRDSRVVLLCVVEWPKESFLAKKK